MSVITSHNEVPTPAVTDSHSCPSTSWALITSEPNSKHVHTIKVENFTDKTKMKTGEYLKSGVFTVKTKDLETTWQVEIYPNGLDYQPGYVSVNLCRVGSAQIPVQTNLSFSLIDKNGRKINTRIAEFIWFQQNDLDFGYKKFLDHNKLGPELLPNGILTLVCELSLSNSDVIVSGSTNPSQGQGITERYKQFSEAISGTFETGKFTDCLLLSEGREFRCHQVILAARSTVFEAMFTHNMKENRDKLVKIDDIDNDTLHSMLLYIYGKEVADFDSKAIKLLYASDKYDLPGLKALCKTSLSNNITIDNVADLLIASDRHKSSSIKREVFKFMIINRKDILSHGGWNNKLRDFPDILSELVEVFLGGNSTLK